MAVGERLPGSLQENLLTLLCHSEEHGKVIAGIVDPALFEGDYRTVAERVVDYWKKYTKPPGPHVTDLLSDILEDPNDRRAPTYRGIIVEMLRLYESVNAQFSVDQLREWMFSQRYQGWILEEARRAAQRVPDQAELAASWHELMRMRDETVFTRGLSLNDTGRLLAYMQARSSEFSTGIPELDRRGVQPVRSETMLFLAPTGIGKTWALIHVAKRAMLDRKRVLFASVELGEEVLGIRFWQSMFGVPKRRKPGPRFVRTFEKDSFGRLMGIEREDISDEIEFTLESEGVADEMEVRRQNMEGRFRYLEIKRWPTRRLTVDGLESYLDDLARARFEPDMLVLDYIGKMKTDTRDHRISLGRTFEDFYGLCADRGIAGVTAQQASKVAGQSGHTTQYNVSEDYSLIGTADVAISISATDAEKRMGLARLYVDKNRNEDDRFGVLLSQNYATGQFALDSAPLPDEAFYRDLLPEDDEEEDDSTGNEED